MHSADILLAQLFYCQLREFDALFISPFCMGDVNTILLQTQITKQLSTKVKRAFLSAETNGGFCNAIKVHTSLWSKQTCLNMLDLCKYLKLKFWFVNTCRLCRFHNIQMSPLPHTFCLHFYLNHIHVFDYPDYRYLPRSQQVWITKF